MHLNFLVMLLLYTLTHTQKLFGISLHLQSLSQTLLTHLIPNYTSLHTTT